MEIHQLLWPVHYHHFIKKIDIAHVEAGLRTGNIYSPYPEEVNRKVTSNLTRFHFAPTSIAKNNLLKEGCKKKNILVTGNTVIDSVLWMNKKIKSKKIKDSLEKKFSFLNKNKNKNYSGYMSPKRKFW